MHIRLINRLVETVRKRPRAFTALVIFFIVVGVIGSFLKNDAGNNGVPLDGAVRTVEMIAVADYAGTVIAEGGIRETVVRAESSGRVIRVLAPGVRTASGTVIAELENGAQRAALLQAEGALEAAQASEERVRGGVRAEQIAVLESSLHAAKSGAVNTLLSAYAAVDSAVRETADQMFDSAEGPTPTLRFLTSNNQRRTDVANMRVSVRPTLSRHTTAAGALSVSSNLASELAEAESEVREVRFFIDALIAALNEAIPSGSISEANIASFRAAATAARSALTGALSSIASARQALAAAEKNLEEAYAGAQDTELAAAHAAVKQAQGAYDAALVAYNKTIIRAPQSGTIASCSASAGDIISVGTDVCRIRISANRDGNFVLPLSSVKYTPAGSFVFAVSPQGVIEAIQVATGVVTARGIATEGLYGDEFIIRDVRGLKAGEKVEIKD